MKIKKLNEEFTKFIEAWGNSTLEAPKGRYLDMQSELDEYKEKLKWGLTHDENCVDSSYRETGAFALYLSILPKLKFGGRLKRANIQLEGLSQEFIEYMNNGDNFNAGDWAFDFLIDYELIDTNGQVTDFKGLYDYLSDHLPSEEVYPSEINLDRYYRGEFAPKNKQEERVANEVIDKMIKYVEEPYKRNLAKLEKYLPAFD